MKKKNLVFSSVGDRTNFPKHWLDKAKDKEFDIWVVCYGENQEYPWEKDVDLFVRRKGAKVRQLEVCYGDI